MKRPTSSHSGFTLIELLIVVVILSTLAAIVVPQFASSSDSAKVAAAKSSLNGIRSALSVYQTDKGNYPLESDPTYCTGFTGAGSTDTEKLLHSLSYYTDSAGQICDTNTAHPQGPYMRANEFPTNPIVGTNSVKKVDTAKLGLAADDTGSAWLYQPATGEFIINDSTDDRDKY